MGSMKIIILSFVCFAEIITVEIHHDVLERILGTMDTLHRELNALKNVTTVLGERTEQLEKDNAFLVKKNKLLENSVKQHKRLLMSPELPITFTVRIDNIVDHVSPNDVIPFHDILTNNGGGFDPKSNQFVAPIAGIYIFSCSLLDHTARVDGSGVMLHADIVKNGAVLGRVFAHAEGRSYRDQGANTVFVELQVGDKVWVRNYDSPNLSIGGELYSTFSGYLLWPLE